jgi:hypothetical protein
MRKKALLIGIRKIRKEKKKAQKDRVKEAAPETSELKGPHRDVLEMEQLLLSA